MPGLYETVFGFFHDQGWPFSEHDSLPILRIEYAGASGPWTMFARVRDDAEQVIVLSQFPTSVPSERRGPMAEFITRANYGLNIGNFEMDFDDGEVRFRTSVDVEGTELDAVMVGSLVGANLAVMDDYYRGIAAMLDDGASAADTIAEIEAA